MATSQPTPTQPRSRPASRWLPGLLGAASLIAVLGLGWHLAGRERPPDRILAAAAAHDYAAAAELDLASAIEPSEGLLGRLLPGFAAPLVGPDLSRFEAGALGFQSEQWTFTTLTDGVPRPVRCLFLTPAAANATDRAVTIYLLSSGARQGTIADAEAILFANRFNPPRRVLAVPLAVAEQRGEPWPVLADLDLLGFQTMVRQTALDVRRAVDLLAAQGATTGGLAGFSLGGCVAAVVAGLHPAAFADQPLTLWAAGGNLPLLVKLSDHRLVRGLTARRTEDEAEYNRRLAAIDPVNHIGRAQVSQVDLIAGIRDAIIPMECAVALADSAREAGLPTALISEDSRHYLGASGLQTLREMVGRARLPAPEQRPTD